jgi:hypothetical protein
MSKTLFDDPLPPSTMEEGRVGTFSDERVPPRDRRIVEFADFYDAGLDGHKIVSGTALTPARADESNAITVPSKA